MVAKTHNTHTTHIQHTHHTQLQRLEEDAKRDREEAAGAVNTLLKGLQSKVSACVYLCLCILWAAVFGGTCLGGGLSLGGDKGGRGGGCAVSCIFLLPPPAATALLCCG